MKFTTKGRTLAKLQQKGFNIPKLILINQKDFLNNKNKILFRISNLFKNKIALRSSALNEDSDKGSLAGKYLSFLNVDPKNIYELNDKLIKIINSYKNNRNNNEVIVQEMINDCKISGVCTTVDLHNYLPIINVNYDKNSRTDTVTSGHNNSNTFTIFKKKIKYIKNKKFKNLLLIVKRLQKIFDTDLLDIEFAINNKNKIFILQVRKIIILRNKKILSYKVYERILKKLEKKILKLQEKNYDLYGNTNCFGVMPDWNPAEIIGIKPKPLSLSLYKELITDHIWSKNRHQYGFKNLEAHHLITTFFGTPYVDVRVDFNSWIPKDLNSEISKKLVNFYLKKFKNNSNLHDKIEFKILFTCFAANTSLRLKGELTSNFNKAEIIKIKNSLKKINNIAYKSSFLDLKKINLLKKRQITLDKSKIYPINKIYFLIEDCKKFGTLPFAGLARCGFIAIDILNSFVETNIITQDEKNKYLGSIKNIASNITNDYNKLSKKKFCKIYGHLRPNTYDINSLNYNEGYKNYFGSKNKLPKYTDNFYFTKNQLSKIDYFLKKNRFNINSKQLNKFIRNSIYNREYAKFIFTKSIDLIFKNLIIFAKKNRIKRDDLSFVDIHTIIELNNTLNYADIKNQIKDQIRENKITYKFNSKIHLAETICSTKDLYYSYKNLNNGNFITQKIVNFQIIHLKDIKDIKKIKNKIVLIDSADPGYDFIFSKKIQGLITKFGGQNSHMSIRAAELSLPACIGIGENKFNSILEKKIITLDCLNKKVY